MKTKSLYVLSFVIITCSCSLPHVVDIPDPNFKNALLNTNCIDTDGDGKADSDVDINNDNQIQLNEIVGLEFLDVSSQNIRSLEGIHNFINLKALDCYKNELTNLDVSKNSKLEILFCFDNQIENLDVSRNANLIELGCRGNKLSSLDLSRNKNLNIVYCYQNELTHLNLKNGNNQNISSMWAFDNSNLFCIEVDNTSIHFPSCDRESYSGWCKDSIASYSNKCSN